MNCHDNTIDDAAEDLGGSPDAVENEFGSRDEGEAFESLASIVGRLLPRWRPGDDG